jgi:hypothetical protein
VLGSIPKACLLLFSPLQIVMKDRVTDKPRGFGFVTFKEQEAADRAFQDVHVLDGRTVSSISNRNNSSSIQVVLSDRRHLQEQQQQPLRPAVMRAALWAGPSGSNLSSTGLSGVSHQQLLHCIQPNSACGSSAANSLSCTVGAHIPSRLLPSRVRSCVPPAD